MKKDVISVLLILVTSFFLSIPLTKPGFFTVHDNQQIARLYVFDRAINTGQFPVRWVDKLGFGFGYPLFVFYPPLVYMIGEIYHTLSFGFIDSIKLVFFSGIFFSGLAMYIFTRSIFGRLAGLVAATFYMLAPYRALDIYVRGAFAESFAFVWLPLVLWSFYRLSQTKKPIYVALSSLFLALLMITHNLIFLPFMLLLPFYLLFLFLNSSSKKQFTMHCTLSTIFAFGLSAFFWVPALLEKKFTIVDQLLLVNLADYHIHFVYPQQLWNWPWGFGGSAAGLADGISFKIGKLHVVLSAVSLILGVITWIKSRKPKLSTVNYQLSTVLFFLFLLSAFLTTFYSQFIWDHTPGLGYLQFPWRFLTFTTLFSSILAGAFIYFLRVPVLRLVASVIILTLLIIPNYKLFNPQTYRFDLTDKITTSDQVINWDISSSSFEYLPKGVALYKGPLNTNLVKIDKTQLPNQRVQALNGDAIISSVKETPTRVSFDIKATHETKVRINNFNFPGWQLKVDGNQVPIDDNNPLKLITFPFSSGNYHVDAMFKNTPTRTTANMISLLSIILIIAYLALGKKLYKNA